MDSFKIVLLVLGGVFAIAFPVQLVRMVRRRDRGRIFDLLVSAAGLGILFSGAFWPHAIPSPPVRRLETAVLILWLATLFGFGQWLFRPKAKTGQPPA